VTSTSTSPAAPALHDGSGADRQQFLRDALIVVLTFLTGITDAFAFVCLSGVFTSVMTGNMVLMGIGLGHGDTTLLGHSGIAVLAYIAGVMLGGVVSGRHREDDGVWPRRVTYALLVELGLFIAVGAVWIASDASLGAVGTGGVVAIAALGLGVQSSAMIRLNVPGMSTTYLTGTLTTVARALCVERTLRGNGRSALTLVALVAGGTVSTLLSRHAARWVPLMPVLLLVLVTTTATLRLRDPERA
jgi:uncharacterized membrane protein YoaK (UPF0700 family)